MRGALAATLLIFVALGPPGAALEASESACSPLEMYCVEVGIDDTGLTCERRATFVRCEFEASGIVTGRGPEWISGDANQGGSLVLTVCSSEDCVTTDVGLLGWCQWRAEHTCTIVNPAGLVVDVPVGDGCIEAAGRIEVVGAAGTAPIAFTEAGPVVAERTAAWCPGP